MKKILKLFLVVVACMLLGTLSTYAADEENVEVVETPTAPADVQAPMFDPDIQTRYTVKRADDGSEFIPEEVIGKITATDDVDGKNVEVALMHNSVNLADDGEYQVIYTATDKAGNMSYLVIVVTVDGMAPVFAEDQETVYYVYKDGTIFDSKHNAVEALPKTLIAKEAPGAYKGIGVYVTTDEYGNIIFINTIKGTPADAALQYNDILVGIDGEDVRGKDQEYAASKIRGEEGTTVTLDLLRNGEELTVTIERKLIKMYGEIDIVAEPNVDIDTIVEQKGTIEIKYTASDEIGNTAEFVITVIVVEEDVDQALENENGKESEDLYNVTTSGNPPEGINLNIDDVASEQKDDEDKEDVDEDKTVVVNEDEPEEDLQDKTEVEEKVEE